MKKLLSLLGAIALVGSAGTTVVACGSSSKTNNPAQDLANQIKNKDVALIAGSNTDTSNAATNKAIKDAVQTNNKLKSDQMKNITITKVTLKDNEQANTVKANIKIGKDTASVNLNVEIHSTAAQIKTKINIEGSGRLDAAFFNTDTTATTLTKENATKIVASLGENYAKSELSDWDKTQLSIKASGTKLPAETATRTKLNITSDAKTKAVQSIYVEAMRFTSDSDKYKATKVANKIGAGLVVGIPAGSSTVFNDSKAAIKTALKKVNPALTANDLTNITLTITSPATALTNNETDNAVTASISVGSTSAGTATVALTKVQIHSTATQIQTKINNLGRFYATFVSTDATMSDANKALIMKEFNTNNPDLSTWDQSRLSIAFKSGVTAFTVDTRVDVTMTITDDAAKPASQTATLKVARFAANTSDKYKAFKIADKIAASKIVAIKAGSTVAISDATTIADLKTSLENANTDTSLSTADVGKVSFAITGGNLAAEEADNTVTATVTESAGNTDTVTLSKVQIHRTDDQIKALITDIASQNIDITGPAGNTGTGTIDAQIKTALQKAAPKLTAWDLTQISIPSGVALSTTRAVVTLTITDDNSGTTTRTINVETAS